MAVSQAMSLVPVRSATERANQRKSALADIGYASMLEFDAESSSGGEEIQSRRPMQEDDANAILAVSISREQTRLTSSKTPAIEKASILEASGDYFEQQITPPEEVESEPYDYVLEEQAASTKVVRGEVPLARTHSPEKLDTSAQDAQERVEPATKNTSRSRKQSVSDFVRSSLHATSKQHRRGSSLSRALPNMTLPSFAKNFNFSKSSLSSSKTTLDGSSEDKEKSSTHSTLTSGSQAQTQHVDPSARPRPVQRRTTIEEGPATHRRASFNLPDESRPVTVNGLGISKPYRPITTRRVDDLHSLRRTASDESLWLRRSVSIAPTLGDDSRFEHVQQQVNSRVKAIKDTWEDIDFKLSRDLKPIREKLNSMLPAAIKPKSAVDDSHPAYSDKLVTPPSHGRIKPKDLSAADCLRYPNFVQALEELTGDVVVLGGYRGSILRSAYTKRRLWAPVKLSLNLVDVDLEVGLEPEDDDTEASRIIPDGVLANIGPIDICRKLISRLAGCKNSREGKLRVHNYGYDWRLDPEKLSSQLLDFLQTLPDAQPHTSGIRRGAVVIAHSLGGLITRHAVNRSPELFRGVLYAGTPQHAVNILGPFRNGDDVGLNADVLTAQVNYTFRTSFALLPLDGKCFIDKDTGEAIPVDFFNPQDWVRYAWSPCISRPLPAIKPNKPPGAFASIKGSVSSAIPVIPSFGKKDAKDVKESTTVPGASTPPTAMNGTQSPGQSRQGSQPSIPEVITPATAVSIPYEEAYAYLERTLTSVKRFKQALDFDPELASSNRYPPFAVLSATNTPTVLGAKVNGVDGIARHGAYDNLTFGSGDGVVLARAAQLPSGYRVVSGGNRKTTKGHVSLLSDLDEVGCCLLALLEGRRKGIGLGRRD